MKDSVSIAPDSTFTFTIEQEQEGTRLDQFLANQFMHYSRSFFGTLIEEQGVTVNSVIAKKNGIKLKPDDVVVVSFPSARIAKEYSQKELDALGIEVVFEQEDFLILYKPADVLVHPPSEKSESISLVDWILNKFKTIKEVGYTDRPGIVHRLDKDTSGLMIVARNNAAHATISDMFKKRKIHKIYLAIVKGHPEKTGTIDFPIGRHIKHRKKMAHVPTGRVATTHYKVLEYFKDCSLVAIELITGRTHQIRVHFATSGHPVIGDILYGRPSKQIKRQALHAHKLLFTYKEKEFSFQKEVPEDFEKLLKYARKNSLQ